MDIKKRDNGVYDLIGVTEGKMFAILHALDDKLKREKLTAVQYDVWVAISKALEMGDLYEES